MKFLRNCWYVVGHAEDAGTKPFGRKILNEPIVVYRTESGLLNAMDDRCAHRFASMHQGKVCGELLQCPYHGLLYDSSGVCVKTPTGGEPPRARLRSYPIESRHGMLWIWMGDPSLANTDAIPDFSRLERDDAAWMTMTMYAKGNYQLLVDNLLDLSHVEFLHPFLASEGWAARAVNTIEHDGDTITVKSVAHEDNAIGLAMQMKPDLTPVGTSIQTERWDPPSVLQLSVEFYSQTGDWIVPSGHFLTPETETTTHYFLRAGNTVDKNNEAMTAAMKAGTKYVFENEDIAMIEEQQRNLGNADLMDMRPVILPADGGAVRARRVLAKKIREEDETGLSKPERAIVPIAVAVDNSH